MDTESRFREIVKRVLKTYASFRYANGDYDRELILDSENDHYVLMTIGWDKTQRVYYTVIHIDIIDNKLWIQHDATEDGVANDLIAAGVPKDNIVLAFYPIEARRHSEFAAI